MLLQADFEIYSVWDGMKTRKNGTQHSAGRQEMRNCTNHGLFERYESGYQFKQQKELGDDVERRSLFWGKRIEARVWRNESRIDPEEWEVRDDVVAGFSAMGQRNPDGFRSLVRKSRPKTDINNDKTKQAQLRVPGKSIMYDQKAGLRET